MNQDEQLNSAVAFYLSQIKHGINGLIELDKGKGALVQLIIKEIGNSIVLETRRNEAVSKKRQPETKAIKVTFKGGK